MCDALAHLLDRYDQIDAVTADDIMSFHPGAGLPDGGYPLCRFGDESEGGSGLRRAYATGRGQVRLRARVMMEETGRGSNRLVVSELPYQVNKARLIERIAELVRAERITGISDLRDESDRDGMRLVVETARGVDPRQVLADLFRHTPMESTFSLS